MISISKCTLQTVKTMTNIYVKDTHVHSTYVFGMYCSQKQIWDKVHVGNVIEEKHLKDN